ncbi:hypothetical protein [Clostridium sp.]|uniref:hypothetical protein n=1 Tax=Clostridium sp. TaxID=1506 RepID=UPI003464877D
MKDRNIKIISGIIILTLISPILYYLIFKDGRTEYIEELINNTKASEAMVDYNKAEITIEKLEDGEEKDNYTKELEELKEACVTPEVERVMKEIDHYGETLNVEEYHRLLNDVIPNVEDERNIQYYMYQVSLYDYDLFTKDFILAQDAFINLQNILTLDNLEKAYDLMEDVEHEENKQWLKGNIDNLAKVYDKTIGLKSLDFNNKDTLTLTFNKDFSEDFKDKITLDKGTIENIDVDEENKTITLKVKMPKEKEAFRVTLDEINLQDRKAVRTDYNISYSEES